MSDLRERLQALADGDKYDGDGCQNQLREVAIAAYRMAIEDAARAFDDEASKWEDGAIAGGFANRCAATVRALADDL